MWHLTSIAMKNFLVVLPLALIVTIWFLPAEQAHTHLSWYFGSGVKFNPKPRCQEESQCIKLLGYLDSFANTEGGIYRKRLKEISHYSIKWDTLLNKYWNAGSASKTRRYMNSRTMVVGALHTYEDPLGAYVIVEFNSLQQCIADNRKRSNCWFIKLWFSSGRIVKSQIKKAEIDCEKYSNTLDNINTALMLLLAFITIVSVAGAYFAKSLFGLEKSGLAVVIGIVAIILASHLFAVLDTLIEYLAGF